MARRLLGRRVLHRAQRYVPRRVDEDAGERRRRIATAAHRPAQVGRYAREGALHRRRRGDVAGVGADLAARELGLPVPLAQQVQFLVLFEWRV